MNRLRFLLVVALVSLSTECVQAANIAILRPSRASPGLAEAVHRLEGELFALGLEVRIVDRPASGGADAIDARDALERMAAEQKTDALIDVIGDTSPSAVEVWIFEPSSGRSRVSRVVLEPNAPNAAEILAIRAIEVLRSNFVEIDLAARAHSERRVAETSRDESPKQPPRRVEEVGLEAGIAVLGSLDGIGPAFLPLVRLDWAASSWLVAQATLAGLGTRPELETAAGSATVAQSYGLIGLCYLPPFDSAVRPFLSLAAGALRTSLDGQADSPGEGHSVTQWSFVVDAGLGARLRLSDRHYLTPAFHVELAQPYVAVHFVDELVASSGRPNLLGSLTFGIWL